MTFVCVGDEPKYDASYGMSLYGLFLDGVLDTGWFVSEFPDGYARIGSPALSLV